ncbi:hypothetical protein PIB19_05985 [Sphingomonas sp. 7/4-4]|uniref:hypothetical protein n=1 Tax=Sphingomonas sp. 7/4-4 TaxID=3018446 RepID=UPI0022F40246|nr:hypothetical protein [Sphingomonas sp. 7/4-4]WBY08946.1 hypothetical protein PIB19_05985 [Sphingomonas sp. 7/4-4]
MAEPAQHLRAARRALERRFVDKIGTKIITAAVRAHDDPADLWRTIAVRMGVPGAHWAYPQAGHFQPRKWFTASTPAQTSNALTAWAGRPACLAASAPPAIWSNGTFSNFCDTQGVPHRLHWHMVVSPLSMDLLPADRISRRERDEALHRPVTPPRSAPLGVEDGPDDFDDDVHQHDRIPSELPTSLRGRCGRSAGDVVFRKENGRKRPKTTLIDGGLGGGSAVSHTSTRGK